MSYTINVRRIGDHNLPLPSRAHASAGYDLASTQDRVIYPGEIAVIPTGFAWEILPTVEQLHNVTTFGLIRDRSGMATRTPLIVVAGVVDGDYRGEVGVALRNVGDEPYPIHVGDRIAQMILITAFTPALEEVQLLDETKRGTGAMGSTGITVVRVDHD